MELANPIWSIGHSNYEMPKLIALLRGAGIEVIADLRSQPYSRFKPHFNREPLQAALSDSEIQYVFLGDELGGRPPEPDLYDPDGHVLYGEVAKTGRFLTGISRLLEGSEKYRVAMLCSEEDPFNCHRRLLVTRVLADRDVPVIHIRGDGTTISEAELDAAHAVPVQTDLFTEEDSPWLSTRSVSRSTPQNFSSTL